MTDRSWRTWDPSRDAFRASDFDREAVAETLRAHHTAGRLTDDEFQDRLERSMAAKTLGDLRPLVADLPDGSYRDTRRRWAEWTWAPFLPVMFVALFAFLAAIARPWHMGWYRPYHHHWFPAPFLIVCLVAGIALLRRRWACWHGGQPD